MKRMNFSLQSCAEPRFSPDDVNIVSIDECKAGLLKPAHVLVVDDDGLVGYVRNTGGNR